jgi:acyl carrier protein
LNPSNPETLEQVKTILVETLGLEDRADSIGPETQLFGALPELDSLAVVELLVELENRLGIEASEEAVTAENFETLASLAAFVDSTRA